MLEQVLSPIHLLPYGLKEDCRGLLDCCLLLLQRGSPSRLHTLIMSPGPNHGESFFTRSLLLASHSFPHSFPQLCIGAILRFLQLRSYGTLYSILALSCHTGHRSIQGVLPLLIGEFRGTLALFPCLLVGGIHSLLPLLLGGNRGPLALLFRLFFFRHPQLLAESELPDAWHSHALVPLVFFRHPQLLAESELPDAWQPHALVPHGPSRLPQLEAALDERALRGADALLAQADGRHPLPFAAVDRSESWPPRALPVPSRRRHSRRPAGS
mmetsp:Transcript_18944/g.40308  ORF Transcript_18944/g.40308 Transcript_18944/m.40308 type:complete len:269 (+) Transcript_18944:1021-1827(+)